MKPVIVLLGRPNVGKSTLFNRLTRARDALVADAPGLTRDRQYGTGQQAGHEFIVVDTGGIVDPEVTSLSEHQGAIADIVSGQALQAIEEADVVFFIVDGREGQSPLDKEIAQVLRTRNVPVVLVANKTEGLNPAEVAADFFELGFGEAVTISASHGHRVRQLVEYALEEVIDQSLFETQEDESEIEGPCIAVVGRPNVGKSTLVNALLGEERVVVFDQPGTTRDSIFIPFRHNDEPYTLVDTAGVRRRGKIDDVLEKFSVIKTLKAIDTANIVVLVIDGSEGVTEQDASLAGYILERGRAVVVIVNKWDKVKSEDRQDIKDEMLRRMPFMSFAKSNYVSALKKQGLGPLFKSINQAYTAAMQSIGTSAINTVLSRAVEKTPPPMVRGRRIKLKFGHQGGKNPPTFVIHGNQVDALPEHYRRYLVNTFREAFKLLGTPLRIELRQGKNPFEGRKPSKAEQEKRAKKRRSQKRRIR